MQRSERVIKYWFKIVKCSSTKYIKHIYNVMLQELNMYPNRNSQAKSVKAVLENLGFYNVWLNKGLENENLFLNIFKQRMGDTYLQDWNSEIEHSSRARTYRLFCSFGLNSYFKVALCRFRVSAHRLAVEAGRRHKPNKIPYNERKCQYAILQKMFHFLLECPLYYDLRK